MKALEINCVLNENAQWLLSKIEVSNEVLNLFEEFKWNKIIERSGIVSIERTKKELEKPILRSVVIDGCNVAYA